MQNILAQAYKYLTLTALGAIFLSMVGYGSVFVFFLISSDWGAPVILTAGHERVVQARRSWLDLKLKQVEIEARVQALRLGLRDLDTAQLLSEGWMISLKENLDRELEAARFEHGYLGDAVSAIATDKSTAARLSTNVSLMSRSEKELNAGVIDRQRFLLEKVQEAELVQRVTRLSTAAGDLTSRLRLANEKIQSLEAFGRFLDEFDAGNARKPAPSESARKHAEALGAIGSSDFNRLDRTIKSVASMASYQADRNAIMKQIVELERENRDVLETLQTYKRSPLVKAFTAPAVVVFAPYSNLDGFLPHEPVYACRLFLLWCSRVGRVGGVVDGEADVPHPLFGRQVRGQFLEVLLDDPSAAKYDVLHVGGAPLLL